MSLCGSILPTESFPVTIRVMTEPLLATLARNLADVRRCIDAACHRAQRAPGDVTLVAVTKYAQPEWMRGLYELGCRDFGESRPQQLVQRAAGFPTDVRWHLIGHLQRNKASAVWPVAAAIHSADSLRLLDKLAESARESSARPDILLEVNVSGEASKGGFAPDELLAAWPTLWPNAPLQFAGLMTMAPLTDDPEATRPVFRALRELRDDLQQQTGGQLRLPQLSMGMSGDFEIAIEEGATLVRIGSRLFEGLG
jgi:pyridoxal phosphate enzyme (YggS family)